MCEEKITIQAGLTKEILTVGQGPPVHRGNNVVVNCTGYVNDTKFWSTRDPGQQPFSFTVGVGQVIQGWDQGCLSMKVGEVARLCIAPELGYGSQGFPMWNIPPNASLVFEIEVLSAS